MPSAWLAAAPGLALQFLDQTLAAAAQRFFIGVHRALGCGHLAQTLQLPQSPLQALEQAVDNDLQFIC
ncbi:MAG: hypothetical protein V5B30_16085 [Candidatus Accumulibacter delftensis]|jgi:hypothetical protein